ncbi:MAG: hypothetical protein ACXAC2_04055 [Candidatus Kariarchaeaceae archaeon]|jgi:hypothetical protein
MDLDPKYQNLSKEHLCENCNSTTIAPMHCGHAMHLEAVEESTEWVCWMGVSCGHKEFNACCDNHTIQIQEPLGY